MKLQQKTTLQQNIEKIETANRTTLLAVSAAVSALNNSYKSFWNLPDAELLELLQYLFDNNRLQEVFFKHYNAATALNAILDAGGNVGNRAIAKAAKEIAVEDDQVSFVEQTIEDGVLDNLDSESIIIEEQQLIEESDEQNSFEELV
jgi:hypothetical protein